MLLGFSFPIFWMLHAGGVLAVLYRPLQVLFATEATGWPSFISGTVLYAAITFLFELVIRARPTS